MCFEDPDTNRLEESLEMFTKTTNAVIFKDIPILLIFNKVRVMKPRCLWPWLDLEKAHTVSS